MNTTTTFPATPRATTEAIKAAAHAAYDAGCAPELASAAAILFTWRDISDGEPTPIGKPLAVVYARTMGRKPALLVSAEAVSAARQDLARGQHLAQALHSLAECETTPDLLLAVECGGKVRYVHPTARCGTMAEGVA